MLVLASRCPIEYSQGIERPWSKLLKSRNLIYRLELEVGVRRHKKNLFLMGFDLRHHRLVAFFSTLKQSLVLSQQYYCPKTTFIFTMPIRATLIFFPLFLFLSMPNNFEIGKWSWRKFVGSRNWTYGHLVSRPTLLTTKSPLRWPDFLSGGKHWLKTVPNVFVETHHLSTTRYKSRSKIVEDRTSCSIGNNYEGQKVAEWQRGRMAERQSGRMTE